MSIDPVAVDRNVQAIRGIEQVWSLPGLPDEVKLDLATQAQTPEQLTEFLGGLESDFRAADDRDRQVPVPDRLRGTVPQPEQFPQLRTALNIPNDPGLSLGSQAQSLFAGITGQSAPIELDAANSVRNLKERAISLGYLPEDTVIDDRWDPSLRNVMFEMQRDDFSTRISGDRPGSFSIDQAASFMEDWLTPTGLLRAAVDLDFLPDLERVGEEASGWGDKWRKFFDTKSPRDLVDAITGPVDDLVVPLINTGLMFVGVGNIALFARGAQIMKAGQVFRSVPGGRYLRSALVTSERIGDAAQPSFLSQGLNRFAQGGSGVGRAAAGRTSQQMDAWRNFTAVKASKQTIREGMRLGLASRAEQSLLPGFDGIGLGDSATIEGWADRVAEHPLTWGLGEMLFTPTRLFSPLSAPSADVAQATSKWASNEVVTFEFEQGIETWLRANDTPTLERLESARSRLGDRRQAMAEVLMGDPNATQELSDMMGFIVVAAGLEAEAARTAAARFGDDVSQVWTSAGQPSYHKARNHWLSQLRGVDVDDLDDVALRVAEAEVADPLETGRRAAELLDDPDELRRLGQHHNDTVRRASINQLLATSLEQGALETYLPRVMDRLGNWPQFTDALGEIDDNLELLADARYLAARSEAGGGLALVEGDELASIRPFDESFDDVGELMSGMGEVRRIVSDQLRTEKAGGLFAPLARAVQDRGRFTVQRLENATKQEMLKFISESDRTIKLFDDLQRLKNQSRLPALGAALDPATSGIEVGAGRYEDQVRAILKHFTIEDPKGSVTRLAKYMRQNGVALDDIQAHLVGRIDELAVDPRWSERFGIAEGVEVAGEMGPRRVRTHIGADGLKAKVAEAKRLSKFRAAEIDLDALGGEGAALKQRLERAGYRLVHGVDFLQPDDLIGMVPEFQDLAWKTRSKMSLGNFFGRQETGKLSATARQVRAHAIHDELAKAVAAGGDVRLDVARIDTADLERVQADLSEVVRRAHTEAQENLDALRTKPGISRMGTRVSIAAQGTPFNIADMSNPAFRKRFLQEMTGASLGYSRDEAEAIWKALKRGRQLGFKQRGFAAMEDHFRANPQLVNAMKLLGGQKTTLGMDLAGAAPLRRTTEVSKLVGAQTLSAATGATVGAQFDDEGSLFSTEGLIGAAAGVAGGVAAGRKLAGDFETRWANYAYLADNLAYMRDTLRFSLSPIFDISRYTEAALLTKIGDAPSYLSLADSSPRLYRRSLRKSALAGEIDGAKGLVGRELDEFVDAEWAKNLSEFRDQGLKVHGWDQSVNEDLSRWYRSVGIAGFDPSAWMTATFASLRRQGLEADAAYDHVTRMFTYGTTGRSAAELSMNTVFFPFSFTKKTLGHVTRFLGQDLSRAAVMHDYFKLYEMLNERFDLTERFRDQLPFIRRLNRLNLFAYGTSLGEFGGANRPLIDFATEVGSEVFGVFMPFAGNVKTARDSAELQDLITRLLPVTSDLMNMTEDLSRQGEVVHGVFTDRPALTKDAEGRRAFDEWNDFKREINELLKANGIPDGYGALRRTSNTALDPLRQLRDQKKQELLDKYPAWKEQQAEQVERIFLRNLEAEQWAIVGQQHVAEGRTNTREAAFLRMQTIHDQLWAEGGVAQVNGVSQNNIEDLPLEVQLMMRTEAERLSEQIPGFSELYRRYFEFYYGTIETRLV
ncbi:MAG: hypothetical protein AAGA99_00630 [Actinomycetota bacterium]